MSLPLDHPDEPVRIAGGGICRYCGASLWRHQWACRSCLQAATIPPGGRCEDCGCRVPPNSWLCSPCLVARGTPHREYSPAEIRAERAAVAVHRANASIFTREELDAALGPATVGEKIVFPAKAAADIKPNYGRWPVVPPVKGDAMWPGLPGYRGAPSPLSVYYGCHTAEELAEYMRGENG